MAVMYESLQNFTLSTVHQIDEDIEKASHVESSEAHAESARTRTVRTHGIPLERFFEQRNRGQYRKNLIESEFETENRSAENHSETQRTRAQAMVKSLALNGTSGIKSLSDAHTLNQLGAPTGTAIKRLPQPLPA
jgi:hypothetical protein